MSELKYFTNFKGEAEKEKDVSGSLAWARSKSESSSDSSSEGGISLFFHLPAGALALGFTSFFFTTAGGLALGLAFTMLALVVLAAVTGGKRRTLSHFSLFPRPMTPPSVAPLTLAVVVVPDGKFERDTSFDKSSDVGFALLDGETSAALLPVDIVLFIVTHCCGSCNADTDSGSAIR